MSEIEEKIEEISKSLSGGDGLEGVVKEIFLDDLMNSNQAVRLLAREVSSVSESVLKETVVAIKKFKSTNPKTVLEYQEDDFVKRYIEKAKEMNPGMDESKTKLIRQKAREIFKVLDKSGFLGQGYERNILEKFGEHSSEELKKAWLGTKMSVGLINMGQKEVESLVEINKGIDSKLNGINLPYQGFTEAVVFDEAMRLLDDNEPKDFFGGWQNIGNSIKGGFNQISQNVGGWLKERMSGFVENSVDSILKNGLREGMKSILKGGISGAIKTTGATGLGITTGPLGWAVTAGLVLKKGLTNILEGLGLGSKKFLSDNLGKLGEGLLSGLVTGVAAISKITAGIGVLNISVTAPILIVIGFMVLIGIVQTPLISGIVPIIDEGGALAEAETISNTSSDGMVITEPTVCSVADKTVATWQCSSENASTYINKSCPKTTVTGSDNTICRSGCGLVSTAIILQAHNAKLTPKYLVTEATTSESDFLSPSRVCPSDGSSGIGWTAIKNTLKLNLGEGAIDYELGSDDKGVKYSCNEEWIKQAICKGDVVMVLFRKEKGGGHWVTAVAVLESGDIVLKDPSYGRENKEFNYLSNYLEENKEYSPYIQSCLAVKSSFI